MRIGERGSVVERQPNSIRACGNAQDAIGRSLGRAVPNRTELWPKMQVADSSLRGDGISKGTLANAINLLDYDKKVLLFSAPKNQFFTLRTAGDLDHTLRASGIRDVAAVLTSLEAKQRPS
jgi:hypothetical protein